MSGLKYNVGDRVKVSNLKEVMDHPLIDELEGKEGNIERLREVEDPTPYGVFLDLYSLHWFPESTITLLDLEQQQ
jgi:hypothetical protein